MADKVIGGTPVGSRSLCATCRAAHRIVGLNFQEVVYCRQVSPMVPIRFPVSECSIYDDKRSPSLYQMEQIAWAVTSRSRGAVGFGGNDAHEVHIEPPIQNPQVPQGQPPITGASPSPLPTGEKNG
jgi:hypothetical protein